MDQKSTSYYSKKNINIHQSASKYKAKGKVLLGFSGYSDSNKDDKGNRFETVTDYYILLKKLITRF